MNKKNTNTSSGKKKSKITFPKVMLVLAIVVVLGIVGYVIFDKINSSAVKDISIGGAYSELYVGNPEYDEVSYNVSVYPSNANQAFRNGVLYFPQHKLFRLYFRESPSQKSFFEIYLSPSPYCQRLAPPFLCPAIYHKTPQA